MRLVSVVSLALLCWTMSAVLLSAATFESFATVLKQHCVSCHNDKDRKGEVSLQNQVGYADVDGDRLLEVIQPIDGRAEMPKTGLPLSRDEIAVITKWIGEGGNWPDDYSIDPREAATNWWSLHPIRRSKVPAPVVEGAGATNPIDRFVSARLRREGLVANPPADRRTLIRRVYFDLIGLPPAPEEIDALITDSRPHAYERLIDRLLASPRHGERWARHWLDIVHYGETHGYDKDKLRPNAWPYRDYVIRAFNEDTPYARFVEEQIAGDVLFPHDPRAVEATGFLVAGPFDWVGHIELAESADKDITRNLDRDDMVATTLNTFMSVTVQCARCHDHKFDPVAQDEYYGLQAVFAGIDRADRAYDLDPQVAARRAELDSRIDALEQEKSDLDVAIARQAGPELEELQQRIAALTKANGADKTEQLRQVHASRHKLLEDTVEPTIRRRQQQTVDSISRLQQGRARLPSPSTVFAAATEFSPSGNFRPTLGKPRAIHVLARGDVRWPLQEVRPAGLACVTALSKEFALPAKHTEGTRRAALARWISDPRNPLTWRSIVNRVWQYHFGLGIVDSPNDFGRMGQLPSHPDLLDWLAAEFRDGGQFIETAGSLKQLHRLIVTSQTYRRESTSNDRNIALDRDNRFLWRMHRRRLEAEAVRDTVLQLAGKLDTHMYGPGFHTFVIDKPEHSPHFLYGRHDPDDADSQRRSIYRFVVRSVPDPFLEVLDCADPSQIVAKRNETVTALSSLAMLNNKFMVRMSSHFANRVFAATPAPLEQIQVAFREAMGRPPTDGEQAALADYLGRNRLANMCRLLLNSNEFVFVD